MRSGLWLSLWTKEFLWRITNPKIYSLLLTALLSIALIAVLSWAGWWGAIPGKDGTKTDFILESPVGLFFAAIGGITGLWGLAALFTESIVPGSDTLAERLNLGSGDPFARFSAHFARTMRRVRRPVLVVVDDLDRCEPNFVVDLIRGIQTLLRSPRVVFVDPRRPRLDRAGVRGAALIDEQARCRTEQTFGARFVEKAIQMSFILPALGDEARLGYVRHVVLGERARTQRVKAPTLSPQSGGAAARHRQQRGRALDDQRVRQPPDPSNGQRGSVADPAGRRELADAGHDAGRRPGSAE